MAKRKQASRSNAIRKYLEANPAASTKQVVEELGKQGTEVTASLVYNVRGRLTQIKVHRRRKARRVAEASKHAGIADPVGLIVKVKELAKEAGGMQNLKSLVDVLAD